MNDSRHYVRVPHVAGLQLLDGESGEGLLKFETRNLSPGGALVETGFHLLVGMRFRVRCELAPEEFIDAEAEVMWVSGDPKTTETGDRSTMGIRFVDLGADDARRIEKFVRAHAA